MNKIPTLASAEKQKEKEKKVNETVALFNAVRQEDFETEQLTPKANLIPKEESKQIKDMSMVSFLKKAVTIKAAKPTTVSPKIREGKYTNEFHLGTTKSGKNIMSNPAHDSHKDFNVQDHTDAYFAHANRLKEMHPSMISPEIRWHHESAMKDHWNARNALVDSKAPMPHQSESLGKALKKAMIAPTKTPDSLKKSDNKPLHEMTRAEYEAKHGKARKNTTVTGGFHPHASAVETALNQGKRVPDHVLKDYPHLKQEDLKKSVNFQAVADSIKSPQDVTTCLKNKNAFVRALAIRSQHAKPEHIQAALKDQNKAVRYEAEKKSKTLEKADKGSYPKELASKNIEAHMLREKENPSKYPGGEKQAIAIGISQAREHKKEPKPK